MKDSSPPTRRAFLKAAGLSALALQLATTRQVFAESLPKRAVEAEALFADLAREYALAPDVVYLNHASIGTMPKALRRAHREYLDLCESNPWLYMWGDAWDEPMEQVRRQAAMFLGCEPEEITFSHNTTETFNLLAQGLDLGAGDEVLFSHLNHSGASVCFFHHAKAKGYTARRFDFPLAETPGLTAADVIACHVHAIRPETKLLVLPHIDNTVGLRHPIREIAREARRLGVEYVAVDAAQSVAMMPVDVQALGVDVYASSAHKWLQAPKGLGLAYVSRRVHEKLRPMWVTWGQQSWSGSARKYEDYGTRNLAEVLTLGHALEYQANLNGSSLGEGPSSETANPATVHRTAPIVRSLPVPKIEPVVEHHRRLWSHAKQRVEANPKLHWLSPRSWPLGASLYSIGFAGTKASEVAKTLFTTRGFVFRPFEAPGLNAIRLSPNTLNTVEELDRLFDALEPFA